MAEPQPILKGSFGGGKQALLVNTRSGGVAPIPAVCDLLPTGAKRLGAW
jgi:hypothetical protein